MNLQALSAILSEAFESFSAHPQCDGQGEQTTEGLAKEYNLQPGHLFKAPTKLSDSEGL